MNNFNIEDSIAFKTSCDKEDAVAKLLGWLQGPVYQDLTISEHGYSLQQLKYMDTLIYTLPEHLTDLRNQALWKTADLYKEKASVEEIDKAINEELDIEDLIKRANLYLIDLEDELGKKELSLLKIDAEATVKNDEIYITLKSLDTWSQKTKGISILEYKDNGLVKRSSPKKAGQYKQLLQENKIIETIKILGHDPLKFPKNPSGKPGIKAKIREIVDLVYPFEGTTTFDKAWERLGREKRIVDSDPPPK